MLVTRASWRTVLLLSTFACYKSVQASVVEAGSLNKHDNSVEDVVLDSSKGDSASKQGEGFVDHGKNQIEWLRNNGGFVSSKIEIRPADLNDPTSRLGMFAKEDIEEDDLLISIPRECMLTSELEEPDWICTTTRNLVREMKLGNASFYAPYVTYLLSQPYGQLPSMWSDAGKDLLLKVTGGSRWSDDQLIPPDGPVGWLDDEWRNECEGSDDPMEQNAFLMVIQRGWDDILLPVYDMMSHRNGKYLNTKSNSVREYENEVEVSASQFIQSGDEIYTSYTHCTDCGGRADRYGTPQILRDYGFVENFPQKWTFSDAIFTLDKSTADPDDEDFELTWHSRPPNEDELDYFEEQTERLRGLHDQYMRYPSETIPMNELKVIRDYTNAVITAMDQVVNVATGMSCAGSEQEEGTCTVSGTRYNSLDEPFEDYDDNTCDKDVSLDFSAYDTIEEVRSQYQVNTFIKHPENHNTCFDLDDIYQICGSYRPHYHEMVVHYTARFLPDIRRVLWVGGGDSMLLHEILKYPNIELVLGLELDQKVTRWAFKHFGSQPHWDHPQLQWWYGDASKSLLMLPKEYFGSFDMVLVDLSETVMSMSVTKELDIMAALSLLLKPEGIFVKNELYFEKLNPIFKHTVQVHYYDVPVICSQCLCLGSNGVDFIQRNLTDHKVDTLFAPLDTFDQDYNIVHDYLTNPGAKRHCASDDSEEEPQEEEKSPGIVMILEAENARGELSASKLKDVIVPTLKNQGLVVESALIEDTSDKVLVVMLKEGYVVARAWPEHKYVAFDIHLWSKFEKHESIKTALLAVVGSGPRSASSFRIVAGGVFGLAQWKEEYKRRGPKFTQNCDDFSNAVIKAKMDKNLVNNVLGKVLDLNGWKDMVVAVMCGPKDQECDSAAYLAKQKNVKAVVPLHTCESIAGDIEYHENSAGLKFACENEILDVLKQSTSDKKISVLVMDKTSNYALAQVINKIAKRGKYRKEFFTQDLHALAQVEDEEPWRKHFVDDFRAVIPREPAFVADLLFNTTENSLEVVTFLSGDELFVTHLKSLKTDIEDQTGLVGDIRMVGGGGFKFQENFKASQWFLPTDYDQRGPYEQWHSQTPTGHQSIFQLEAQGEDAGLSKSSIKNLLEHSLSELDIETTSKPFECDDIGDGSALVAFFANGEGHVIVLFDGRNHIDLNIFTYKESQEFAQSIADKFIETNKALGVALFDEMPRGYGRVVNFAKDIEPRHEPHWAFHLTQS